MKLFPPILSRFSRNKKLDYFFKELPKKSQILEVGCGDGWVGTYLKKNGWNNYTGLDLNSPADVVGDILDWEKLGMKKESYDVIIAFEVIEHVDLLDASYNLLKPGGLLFLTSPVPHFDFICNFLEQLGLAQQRTSPHTNLLYFRSISGWIHKSIFIVGILSQWGVLKKPQN